MKECWLCGSLNEDGDINDIWTCASCGSENDTTFYKPVEKKEEDKVIISNDEVKLPFLKNGDIPVGSKVTVAGEAEKTSYGYAIPIKTAEGQTYKANLNGTSLSSIVAKYGNDTEAWIGKDLTYTEEDVENKKTKALYRGCRILRPTE